ncbi:elongation factor P maturation arginine rhamnosyltransferase EarP [Pandoraea sp.]|uniref:elongation factor P maturation arginine rhamnosyltransferase EarP n=1 Tax=Pandoraea sp. TaxID=1883445 RepID=UPI001203659A|nr:elongation factor P maturation arginine rhamnosyltransferase EarP [Pandoraea sp.]TAL54993.1 MAG: elongation factor P maturation arginine rhamnosyltransferase EarP [Pandoraea sp.]TAM19281.1 MAG: elongation factor P maturation arginine rhamnosyltransferase EarP [Pandoraea sp.]
MGLRCDIFCTVVDNYGDIGVCWRLARQLAAEHGWAVRLWVDDLASFARLRPEIDAQVASQSLDGVDVRHWPAPWPAPPAAERPADVVIEAFACDIPQAYLHAMAECKPAPVWLNMEYLSAEDWVDGCHLQRSPHPRLPLTKIFFFPGFSAATGGLLREHDLLARRDAFQAHEQARLDFWHTLRLPQPEPQALAISLFAYENPALPALLAAWRDGPRPVTCLIPQGRISPQAAAFFGKQSLGPGDSARQGALSAHGLPFLPQDRYDQLLWACDFNFVRGEDSFVRAQWAARPIAWHIYPQSDAAHELKLDAFLRLYCAALPASAAAALQRFWHGWNGFGPPSQASALAAAWKELAQAMPALSAHARAWAQHLARHEDFASALVQLCKNQLK